MAKINRTDVYPYDVLVTMLDYLIGTDANNLKKTRNYKVRDLANLIIAEVEANVEGLDQDNFFRFIELPKFIFTTQVQGHAINEVPIIEGIDILFSYLNLTVTEKQLIIFKVKVLVSVINDEGQEVFKYTQNRKYYSILGKGVYEPLSLFLSASKLEIDYIEAEARPTSIENIEGDVNNVVFDLGDITGENHLEYINTVPNVNYPSGYPLTDNTKIYYFKLQDSTITYMYYFDEGNSANSYGYYGVEGEFIFTEPELILFYKSDYQFPIATTSQLTNNGADGTSTYVEHDELGAAATSNNYNDLNNLPNLSTKENTSNKKTTIAGNESSTTFFGVIKAWIDWFKDGLASQIPAKSTALVDNDRVVVFDSEDGNKTKYRLFSQIKSALNSFFDTKYQPLFTGQVTVIGNITLDDSYNGKLLKIKATCSITVPSTLSPEFNCVSRTFSGCTANYIAGAGVTLDAPDGLILEPFKMATLFKDGSTSTYVLEGETTT